MAERKEYAYGRIGSDYAEIRCIGLGLNSCPGSGMAGRKKPIRILWYQQSNRLINNVGTVDVS